MTDDENGGNAGMFCVESREMFFKEGNHGMRSGDISRQSTLPASTPNLPENRHVPRLYQHIPFEQEARQVQQNRRRPAIKKPASRIRARYQ
jgi:hypothetical protein